MKRLVRTSVLLLLSSIAFSPPASGQKTYALGVGGGGAIPVGKLSDTQSTGYNGIVVLAILPIGVRFDGVYNKFLYRTAPVGSPSASDLRVAAALGNLIFAFSGTSAKPYVVVGGGLYNTKGDIPGANKFAVVKVLNVADAGVPGMYLGDQRLPVAMHALIPALKNAADLA